MSAREFFFENGEKKVAFSSEYGYLWTGPKPIAFLPFTCPSPSSLLKLPNIKNKKLVGWFKFRIILSRAKSEIKTIRHLT